MTDWNEPPWVIREQTRNRVLSLFSGRAAYDQTNVNDDHDTESRRDYSVEMNLVEGVPLIITDTGAAFLHSNGALISYG